MRTHTMLAALLALVMLQQAVAHGGSLHEWSFDGPGYNFTRQFLATCTGWSSYNAGRGNNYVPGPLPFWPTPDTNETLTVSGTLDVWLYLDGTCRETTALMPNLTITTSSGNAYSGRKVYAYGMSGGNCSSGVGDVYRGNMTLGNTRGNLAWWRDGVTTDEGSLVGAAPNVFVARSPGMANPLTTVLLVPPPSESSMLCCNLAWAMPSADAWAAAVQSCVQQSAPTYNRRQARRLNL